MINSMKILDKIDTGSIGVIYKVDVNGKTYALKRQKVYEEDNDTNLTELLFLKFINKLDESDRNFFMEMYDYKFYDNCNFEWTPSLHKMKNKHYIILLNSKKCLDVLLDLKDGELNNLILNNQLNSKQINSMIIQFMYITYILHKNNYTNIDTHSKNICYRKTDENKIINLKQLNMKVPSYGYQFCLIDYGLILSSYDKYESVKRRIKYNMDLFDFIKTILLKIDYNFYSIKGLSTNELEEKINITYTNFDRTKILNIINSFRNDNNELYNIIKNNILKNNIFNDHKYLIDEFEKIEKGILKFDERMKYHRLYDEICQYIQIYDKKYYCALAEIPYMENMIGKDELLFMKNNYNNIVDIIKYFIALL